MGGKKGNARFTKGIYCNREYSWLQFNRRVLDQARDLNNPLLERCKFFSIFHSNLDEFFMVRVGSLLNESRSDPAARENKTRLTAAEQVDGILSEIKKMYKESSSVFSSLKEELSEKKMRLLYPRELDKKQKACCEKYFSDEVLPLLSPVVLDAKHPMIRFENKRTYMALVLEKKGRKMFGVMAVPKAAEKIFQIPDDEK